MSYDDQPEWIQSAKCALAFFLERMGEEEWEERRARVVNYFKAEVLPVSTGSVKPISDIQVPFAVYDDWMGWYLYLLECLVDRPPCDEPMQSARIYPFFASIGRYIDLLRDMEGFDSKVEDVLNRRQNRPDSSLFELLVAIAYARNGWNVRFVPETPKQKTPDLFVTRDGRELHVECKRFAKVGSYAETERQEWLKRWRSLVAAFDHNGPAFHLEVVFKTEVGGTPLDCVAQLFLELLASSSKSGESEHLEMKLTRVDLPKIRAYFEDYSVKCSSPQLIELMAGSYDPFGSYTQAVKATAFSTIGPEGDENYAFNLFLEGMETGIQAKWECVAPESVEAKARDITKMLSKAVSQLPDGSPGAVHIGYETLEGPIVEIVRHEKIKSTISTFDNGDKNVRAVYCHAFQPLSKVGDFECAETTSYFGIEAEDVLDEKLLLDEPNTKKENSTHWAQDFESYLDR